MAQSTVQPLWLLVLQPPLRLNQPDFDIFFTLSLIKFEIKFSNKTFLIAVKVNKKAICQHLKREVEEDQKAVKTSLL